MLEKLNQKVILFGASKLGITALDKLKNKYNIVALSDNDKHKWGTKIEGIEVVPPESIINLTDVCVIVTSMYHKEITNLLKKQGIEDIYIFEISESGKVSIHKYYNFIKDEKDYAHMFDKDIYRKLYEEVGTVEENKEIRWREEWMHHFKPKEGSNILELGAHNGPNLIHYARLGHNITGVELSESLISTFNKYIKLEDNEVKKKAKMVCGWIEEFKSNEKYDYVLCTEVLEHVIDPVKILEVAKNSLKEDGFVYITSPTVHWGNNTHVRGVAPDDLKEWLKKAELSPVIIFVENDRTFCFAKIRKDDKLNKDNWYKNYESLLSNNKFDFGDLEYVDNYIRLNRKNQEFNKYKVIGITRIRNEELIIEDTLQHMKKFVDCFIILDDKSDDSTLSICCNNPYVKEILVNLNWEKGRIYEETKQRQMLYDIAKLYSPEWIFYFDADERFEGDIKEFILSEKAVNINSIDISLFDAYITEDDCMSYKVEDKLYNFRKYFGPEMRNIKMIWRNEENIFFKELDSREPDVEGKSITKFYCQHYGKSLSIQHWEDTCNYYSNHFPEPYKSKWEYRKGKAIHTASDFGRKLYIWDEVKKNYVKI